MRADPEPDDRVSLPEPHGTPVHANANRVDGLARMNPLELDTRVTWIFLPEPIGLARMPLHLSRQILKQVAER